MSPDRQASVRQAAIEMEITITRQVVDLAMFGARPMLIGGLLGKRVSLAEIKRLFKLASRRNNAAGRLPDARKIINLPRPDHATLARLLQDYLSATGKDFDPIDALLATWRVHEQALNFHGASMQVDFELFMVAVRLTKAGQLDLRHCLNIHCEAPNILFDSSPIKCSACNKHLDPLVAVTVRGSEKWSLNPSYAATPRLENAA